MGISEESLKRLDDHWSVQAIGKESIDNAFEMATLRQVNASIGDQIAVILPENNESIFIEHVAGAYELAAIEGIDALLYPSTDRNNELLREQVQAAAYKAYELRRAIDVPDDDSSRIFHILHISALAYCGERWADIRRWLKEHPHEVEAPSVSGVSWENRILYRLFDCWVRLFRKNQWEDLDKISEIIIGLRSDQDQFESHYLENKEGIEAQGSVYQLIALYHWAKATELLATYMLQGEPIEVNSELDKHFEEAQKAAITSGDITLRVIVRWLHVAARRMVSGSLWNVAIRDNPRVNQFIKEVTKKRSLFELLPPQRAAIHEQGLLDQANRAIIVNLPTSGGKTILAQFRILQALNQYEQDNGWVAYVAPTRALVSQVTRRLRRDFEPLNIVVEKLSAAVDIGSCEKVLLTKENASESFHILVTTPEKLSLVIRNNAISRPLALVVLDEAQNIEDESRGLRIELLLATIKHDSPTSNFLLLMPYVPNPEDLTNWLAPENGRTISIGTDAWRPNEIIVGLYKIKKENTKKGAWSIEYETLETTRKSIHLDGKHQAGPINPLHTLTYSSAKSSTNMTAAIASIFSKRGTSIAVAGTIDHAWSMARNLKENLQQMDEVCEDIRLVQKYLAAEVSPDFELIDMLNYGIGVHHAGLSEDARLLIEDLAESSKLKVLCATTTLSQGINFPVSSVFLATRYHPQGKPVYSKPMSSREFWNLAGRAGRITHDSIGVVGIAAKSNNEQEIKRYVRDATEDLLSRIETLLDGITESELKDLVPVIKKDEWSDFRIYIAHLWNEKKNLDLVINETDLLLRNTYGYRKMRSSLKLKDKEKAEALLIATKKYVGILAEHPENATIADNTGFSPEGVREAILGLDRLENNLTLADWEPSSLFGDIKNSMLPQLVGVMMNVPQIKESLKNIESKGNTKVHIAEISQAWVNGASIEGIALKYFSNPEESKTEAITRACRALYRDIALAGTWGISALSRMPTSGIDYDNIPNEKLREINNIPAMIYHGVNTEGALLMRMNSVPRSVAIPLGKRFTSNIESDEQLNIKQAREYLRSLSESEWRKLIPRNKTISGSDYRQIWIKLSGETL